MLERPCPRRRFLRVLAHGGAVAGAVSLGLGCGAGGGPVDGGTVAELPVGTLKAVASDAIAIGHDAKGLYAMSLICPHASCDMSSQGSVSIQAVVCNCHGSVFDGNGTVQQGPARSSLEHYAVTVSAAGAISIDTSQVVDPSTRTAA
jgi:nitrite reductase/ring-hydroxylating ferredoxin subunit